MQTAKVQRKLDRWLLAKGLGMATERLIQLKVQRAHMGYVKQKSVFKNAQNA